MVLITGWFERAFERVIIFEGEYSDDPLDSGGRTKYGITEAVARNFGYEGEMKDLSLEKAKMIYKKGYWNKNRCDEFASYKMAELVFDCGVNMGNNTAILLLQRAYNLLSERGIEEDGLIGPETLNAVNTFKYERDLAFWYLVFRVERYKNIVKNNSSQRRFIRGWGRRVQALMGGILLEDTRPNISFAHALDIVTDKLKENIK